VKEDSSDFVATNQQTSFRKPLVESAAQSAFLQQQQSGNKNPDEK